MKKFLLSVLVTLIGLSGCKSQINKAGSGATSNQAGLVAKTLTKSDAEKILGQPVKLTEQKVENGDGVTRQRQTYTALENEPGTGRSINLYYSLAAYPDSGLAKKAYADIIQSNRHMPGQSELSGMGDEAWYHSDDKNFSLVMVRKSDRLLLIKINKMTSKFSRQELQGITKRLMK